jgi:hypothetical protein
VYNPIYTGKRYENGMANNKHLSEDSKKTQFSSDNQPGNRGRKPSVLRFIKDSGMSVTDVKRLIGSLMWEYDSNELAVLLMDKGNPVPMGMALVLGALADDLKNKSMNNLERLWDRAYGKPTQKDIVEFADIPDSAKERLNRIFGESQAKSAKIKPKTVSEKNAGKERERRGSGKNEG